MPRSFLTSLWLAMALAAGFAPGAWPEVLSRAWQRMVPEKSAMVTAVVRPVAAAPKAQAATASPPVLDVEGALSLALALPAGAARDKALAPVLEAVAAMDAEAALKLLLAQPESAARDDALLTAFGRLAASDLAGAIAWAGKEPFLARAGWILLEESLKKAAATDGPGAWALYLKVRETFADAPFEGVIDAWIGHHPEEAVAFGLAISDAMDRQAMLGRAVNIWIFRDTRGFLTWARKQPEDVLETCFQGASYLNPNGTWSDLAELAQLLPYEKARALRWTDLMKSALSKEGDLSNAPALIRSIPDATIRDQGWAALVLAGGEKDPAAARRWLAEIQDPVSRSKAASHLAAHLALADPLAALAEAQAEPNEQARSFAMRSVVATWLARSPVDASTYLRDHAADFSAGMLSEVARMWHERDAPASIAWARSLPDTKARDIVLNQLASDWMSNRPEAALVWAETNAGGEQMDELLGKMVSTASYQSLPSHKTAGALVNLIQSSQARQAAAVNLMKRWRQTNATAANEWHDAAVRQGRISAVPMEPVKVSESASEQGQNLGGNFSFLEVRKPGYLMSIAVEGRSFLYQGRGVSFTVFY